MQDTATIHKTNVVTRYYTEQKVDVLPWLAYSPDLNPKENVWAEMQKPVFKYVDFCMRFFYQVSQSDRIEKLLKNIVISKPTAFCILFKF